MKKIIFLLASIMYCLSSTGQQISLSNTANINPSKNFQKLSKEQASSFALKRFKSDKIALSVLTNPDHTYLVDSILVTLFYGNKPVKDDYLSETKKGFDDLHKKHTNYTSGLEMINNNKILVISYRFNNVGYIDFYCCNKDNTMEVNGGLQFDIADKDKATVILDDLLKNIKFTTD
jgi:hypothetical protein